MPILHTKVTMMQKCWITETTGATSYAVASHFFPTSEIQYM